MRADGTLLALRDRFLMNTGAYVRTHGSVVPGMTSALLPGPYRWTAYRLRRTSGPDEQDAGRDLPRARPLRGELHP